MIKRIFWIMIWTVGALASGLLLGHFATRLFLYSYCRFTGQSFDAVAQLTPEIAHYLPHFYLTVVALFGLYALNLGLKSRLPGTRAWGIAYSDAPSSVGSKATSGATLFLFLATAFIVIAVSPFREKVVHKINTDYLGKDDAPPIVALRTITQFPVNVTPTRRFTIFHDGGGFSVSPGDVLRVTGKTETSYVFTYKDAEYTVAHPVLDDLAVF
jgi:hypothetical protein